MRVNPVRQSLPDIATSAPPTTDAEARLSLGDHVHRSLRMAIVSGKLSKGMRLNEAFHNGIHAASGAVHITRPVDQQRLFDRSARRVIHSDPGDRSTSLREHAVITAAIERGETRRRPPMPCGGTCCARVSAIWRWPSARPAHPSPRRWTPCAAPPGSDKTGG